jgi:hypothetical protein
MLTVKALFNGAFFNKALFEQAAAGLLAVAVVGGVDGLLTMSLASTQPMSLVSTQPMLLVSTQPKPAIEVATVQTTIETVVVFGHRPANYASLVAHRKHKGTAGTNYAAMPHAGLGTIALR